MGKKRIILFGFVLIAIIAFFLWKSSPHEEKFDEEQFEADVTKIETQYAEHQELVQKITQAFWDDETLKSISVSSGEEGTMVLWTSDGKVDSFEESYPQLFHDAKALLDSDFQWDHFARAEEEPNCVRCKVLFGRYYTGHGTVMSLWYFRSPMSEPDFKDYSKQLSDDCWLVAQTRPFD